MFPDFKELLSCFNAHRVKYLIVGGYAVSFYAQPRATKDLDIFIKADPQNAQTALDALRAFGAPLENLSISDLADPTNFIRFGREPIAIDLLPEILGVDFDGGLESARGRRNRCRKRTHRFFYFIGGSHRLETRRRQNARPR